MEENKRDQSTKEERTTQHKNNEKCQKQNANKIMRINNNEAKTNKQKKITHKRRERERENKS